MITKEIDFHFPASLPEAETRRLSKGVSFSANYIPLSNK